MRIGEKLRARRNELKMTRGQLAKLVHVTPSAIANYENGISYPKTDILISLMNALLIDANYLYLDYLSQNKIQDTYSLELRPDEKEAYFKYQALSPHGKRIVQMVIDEEYSNMRKEDWVEFPCLQPRIRKLPAGFLLSHDSSTIQLKKKHLLDGMDFCFQLHENRCLPVFHAKDILALAHTPAKHNEMGLFQLNDIYYIRILSCDETTVKLRSLNVMDPDIVIKDRDSLECVGKILGRIYGPCRFVNTPSQTVV